MATLTMIGGGAHACDISYSMPRKDLRRYEHHDDWFADFDRPFPHSVIIGINDPQLRAKVSAAMTVKDLMWVHPHAYIGLDCTIGYGTHINYGVTMTRTTIGHHTTISPGVTICGDVTIGDRVFIGAGSTIRNLVTIGDDAFIRMGSVVTRDVAAGERY